MKEEKETKEKKQELIEIDRKGANIAAICMLVLALIYYTYEIFSGKGSNPALYSIITIYNTVLFGYKAVKTEDNRKINIITSAIWGLLTILLIYFYFTGK